LTHVSIKELTKVYPGATEPSLDRLSLEIPTGELTALLGPSGCGKTTTMKMIAGLLEPTSGDVTFDGRSVLKDKPEDRGVVMVFQNYLLFPYMSVADNVGFGLKMRKVDPAEIKRRVGEMLDLVKLPDLGDRKPSALSGGQQQRVALARALIVQPNVLLLADRVALILDGRMKQYDLPDAFYKRPVDEATARFFGGHNFVPGTSDGRSFDSPLGKLTLPEGAATGQGKLTFRPENVRIAPEATGENTLNAVIADIIYLGTQTRLKLRVGETEVDAVMNPNEVEAFSVGDTLPIYLPISTLWVIR
jgi:ABC-type Fe3+/spermidine/putrescine transport system ATPase subunit